MARHRDCMHRDPGGRPPRQPYSYGLGYREAQQQPHHGTRRRYQPATGTPGRSLRARLARRAVSPVRAQSGRSLRIWLTDETRRTSSFSRYRDDLRTARYRDWTQGTRHGPAAGSRYKARARDMEEPTSSTLRNTRQATGRMLQHVVTTARLPRRTVRILRHRRISLSTNSRQCPLSRHLLDGSSSRRCAARAFIGTNKDHGHETVTHLLAERETRIPSHVQPAPPVDNRCASSAAERRRRGNANGFSTRCPCTRGSTPRGSSCLCRS